MKHAKVRTKKAVKKRARPSVGPRTAAAPGTREKELEKLVFLARVNMIELEHQNDELRATEAELESSRQKYVSLFDFSPIAYFGLDLAGIIREANLLAAKILGLTS